MGKKHKKKKNEDFKVELIDLDIEPEETES